MNSNNLQKAILFSNMMVWWCQWQKVHLLKYFYKTTNIFITHRDCTLIALRWSFAGVLQHFCCWAASCISSCCLGGMWIFSVPWCPSQACQCSQDSQKILYSFPRQLRQLDWIQCSSKKRLCKMNIFLQTLISPHIKNGGQKNCLHIFTEIDTHPIYEKYVDLKNDFKSLSLS